jgi:CHAT domain-containing protein/Tfp pilus assembly protein PilF
VVLCLLLATQSTGPTTRAADASAVTDIEIVRLLFREGRYIEAETEARRLLDQTERASGAGSLETAEVLDLLVEILTWQKKVDGPETLALAERALEIRERRLDLASPARAQSLYRVGMVYFERNAAERAREVLDQSLKIRREAFGPEHPAVAESLEGLGLALVLTGEWDRALELSNEALRIRERRLDPNHPDIADSRMTLGALAFYSQDYAAAERHFRRALEIRQISLGARHPKVAGSLQNLAAALQGQGDVRAARDLYERALDIRYEKLEPDDPRLAVLHIAVATLSQSAGDYTTARENYYRAVGSIGRRLGTHHEDYAIALTQLAHLNQLVGDFQVARQQFEEALEVRRETLGASSLDVAKNLSALGFFLVEVGEVAEAKARFEEALRIRRDALPSDSPAVADALWGLGLSLHRSGEPDRARALLEESIRILEKSLGAESPKLIPPFRDLAEVLYTTGDLAAAESILRRGVDLTERYYGTDHPFLITLLHRKARTLASSGRTSEGFESALRAAGLASDHLRDTVRALPERQGLTYAAQCNDSLGMVFTILTSLDEPTSEEVQRAWDALIGIRSVVLDEMVARHRDVAGVTDAAVRELVESLRSERQALANLVVRGPGNDDPEQYAAIISDLRKRVEELEGQLAIQSGDFQERRAREGLGFVDVERNLPRGSALIAYTKFDRYDPKQPSASPVPAYIALVLPACGDETVAIDLGTASSVDRAVASWRTAVSRGGSAAETAYPRVAGELRERIWDPLAPFVEGAERVFVVPDGSLNLVNLAALPDDSDGYLVESGPLLHLLTAETDLVPSSDDSPIGTGLLAMGGPDFEVSAPSKSATVGSSYRGSAPSCTEFGSIAFSSLPHAAVEVVAVADLWNAAMDASRSESEAAVVVTGSAATETAFKQLAPGRRVLHIATHGFFLNDRCVALSGDARGVGGLAAPGDRKESNWEGDSQAYLSGLVLAGANVRAAAPDGAPDGILTAEEIATLHLDGVEWVVLSACDTGVGRVQVGEGVFGLRRAFRVAGARTLIMSLWPVVDEAAGAWMGELYRQRTHAEMDTDHAVRHATLAVLRARRSQRASTHPFYWGGFVAAGEWR